MKLVASCSRASRAICCLQRRRPVHRHAGPAVIGHRRIRPIRRATPQRSGIPANSCSQIGQLPGDTLSSDSRLTDLLPLPQRVIGVLHRQRRPLRDPTRAAAHRPSPDLPPTAAIDPPSAAMWCTTATSTCSPSSTRNSVARTGISADKSKLRQTARADGRLQPLRRPVAASDYLPPEICLLGRHDHLSWHTIDSDEQRAQALLAGNDIGQGRAQGVSVERPAQP